MGRAGRTAVAERLPRLRRELALDFVVVNAENASGGMGLTAAHATLLLEAGADCLTLGDHAFDQRDMLAFIEQEPRVLRPLNYARAAPGHGARFFDAPGGRRVFVAQVLGRVFMRQPVRRPVLGHRRRAEAGDARRLGRAVVVDVHAEATSEKMAMGHWCDGRASLVVGTHTHVPTADLQILERGAAYQTDAGMCGDYDSVIGMDKLEPLTRFVTGMSKGRFEPAAGEATLCGVYVETDDATGRARHASAVRLGGRLAAAEPEVSRAMPVLALVAAGAAWGLTLPLLRVAVSTGYPPLGLILWQKLIMAATLGGLLVVMRLPLPRLSPHLGLFAVVAVFGAILPGYFTFLTARDLPAGVRSLIIAVVPMFVLPMALVLGFERPDARRALGVVLGAGAIALIAMPGADLPAGGRASA